MMDDINNKEGGEGERGISRRGFIKKGAQGILLLTLGSVLSTLESCAPLEPQEKENEKAAHRINNISKKPIHLRYKKIVNDKDVNFINFPESSYDPVARVAKCLRRKPITDAVEERYHIPRGLLLAMMAQEGMGDPLLPNLSGDGGLGLIHMQGNTAHSLGLKTLPRFNNKSIDYKHGKMITNALQKHRYDIAKLIPLDDRFHPVMAIDASARYVIQCKNDAIKAGKSNKDIRFHALCRNPDESYMTYSARVFDDYGVKVLEYRAKINKATNTRLSFDLFSPNTVRQYNSFFSKSRIKKALPKLKFSINQEIVDVDDYWAYFEESMQNFELEKYVALGDSVQSNQSEDTKDLPESVKERIKHPKMTKSNTAIKKQFVDTRQHNSDGYRLFRYRVKTGDNATKLADSFDKRDKKQGNKYKETGPLNIVGFNGEPKSILFPGETVYIRVKR